MFFNCEYHVTLKRSLFPAGFSPDGLVWTWSDVEPYDNVVPMADGTRQYFATMERPKFLCESTVQRIPGL